MFRASGFNINTQTMLQEGVSNPHILVSQLLKDAIETTVLSEVRKECTET